jgi:hypothetical protein
MIYELKIFTKEVVHFFCILNMGKTYSSVYSLIKLTRLLTTNSHHVSSISSSIVYLSREQDYKQQIV